MLLVLLFFTASLTPTLIPRSWLIQGVFGGIAMGLGYLMGRMVIALWQLLQIPEPIGKTLLIVRMIVGIPVLVTLVLCLKEADNWQNGVRIRMRMDVVDGTNTIQMILLSLIVFAFLVLVGYTL